MVDAEVHDHGLRIAVEVELTPKTRQRTIEIMKQVLHGYRGTFYFVTDATQGVVREAWQEIGSPKNIRIQEAWFA